MPLDRTLELWMLPQLDTHRPMWDGGAPGDHEEPPWVEPVTETVPARVPPEWQPTTNSGHRPAISVEVHPFVVPLLDSHLQSVPHWQQDGTTGAVPMGPTAQGHTIADLQALKAVHDWTEELASNSLADLAAQLINHYGLQHPVKLCDINDGVDPCLEPHEALVLPNHNALFINRAVQQHNELFPHPSISPTFFMACLQGGLASMTEAEACGLADRLHQAGPGITGVHGRPDPWPTEQDHPPGPRLEIHPHPHHPCFRQSLTSLFDEDGAASQVLDPEAWEYHPEPPHPYYSAVDPALIPSRQYWEYLLWQETRHPYTPFSAGAWGNLYFYQKVARVHSLVTRKAARRQSSHRGHPTVSINRHCHHHPQLVHFFQPKPPEDHWAGVVGALCDRLKHLNQLADIHDIQDPAFPGFQRHNLFWHLDPFLNPQQLSYTQLLLEADPSHLAWWDCRDHHDPYFWDVSLECRWWHLKDISTLAKHHSYGHLRHIPLSAPEFGMPLKCWQRVHLRRMRWAAGYVRFLLQGPTSMELDPTHLGSSPAFTPNSPKQQRALLYVFTCIHAGVPLHLRRQAFEAVVYDRMANRSDPDPNGDVHSWCTTFVETLMAKRFHDLFP